ncbi:unnamed protein product [Paramecium sonneborni]|uniref:Transmembrane protein n=1 Tax=Paramecium sonneborni TaxID=65129 RepID=A0A8S1QZJ7_9CILI|nr:unnamed protein product [Paramecium sonneborni]
MKYENNWYFFGIVIIPSEQSFRFSILQGEILVGSELFQIQNQFKDQELKIVFGGGLIVEQSQILKIKETSQLSYFPGKLSVLYPSQSIRVYNDFGYDLLKRYSIMYNPECICDINQIQNLPDFQITKVNQDMFASENKNCDEFSLETWIKIEDFRIVDQQFVYKLMKLSANFENNYANNEKLSAFQLFYEFQDSQIKIIVTTYNILFPLVDYYMEQQLLKKEWIINNNIKLWHFLSVILSQNVLNIQITFYEGFHQIIYETQFIVNQFHEVQFKFQYGNLLQQSSNYLIGILKSIKFVNNVPNFNNVKACHYSCEECEGPTKTDCLSCPNNSKRIYVQKYKVCLCPFNYIDDIECKGLEDYQLFAQNLIQDLKQKCPQGYFNQGEQCQKCPSHIKDNFITCLECIQNPNDWQNNPYCQTNLYMDDTESPANYLIDQQRSFYIFDGIQTKLCQLCLNQDLYNIENIYNDFLETNIIFNKLCLQSNRNSNCYSCSINNCEICFMELSQQICLKCFKFHTLVNGNCNQNIRGLRLINNCTMPYYITSEMNCKLCEIEYCQYCFEYISNDLSKSTLYSQFETFKIDEFHKVGCALCQKGFIFDFIKGICIYQQSTLPNCLRSFINLIGQEQCTLSAIQDFQIAPEIINCQRYISNCKQCIQTPQSIVKCIICEDGYSSSLTTGHCTICQQEYAKVCIEGDYTKQDAWIQLIQSFLMQFLPNKYFYPKSTQIQYITPLPIQCIDNYELNQNFCRLFCDQNCILCKKEIIPYDGFICKKCSLNYYMEHLKSIKKGKCITCPLLCQVCQERTTQEIQQINPEFLINDFNIIYTYKCIQKRQNSNVILDPYYQIAKYCFNDKCDSLISYTVNNCNFQIFDESGYGNIEEEINFQYLNHIGTQKFQLIILIQDKCSLYEMDIQWLSLTNKLRKNIFSLIWVDLIFQGNHSPAIYESKIKIYNFDSITLDKILFQVLESLELYIPNYNTTLIITDSNFYAIDSNPKKIQIQLEQCFHFEFRNITLRDLNLLNSVIFLIQFQTYDNNINLLDFTIRNCNLTNTTIFYLNNLPKKLVIQNVRIENCQFYNSTIFNLIQDINTHSNINFNLLQITESTFFNSILINSKYINLLNFSQILLKQNQIEISKFLQFQNSLIIKNFKLEDNQLFQSFIFYKMQENLRQINLQMDSFDIQNNVLINTSLVFMEKQSTIYQVYINLTNFYLNENRIPKAVNFSTFLFHITCYSIQIKQFQIINSYHLQYFYLLSVTLINVEDLLYANQIQKNRVAKSIECLENKIENSQLFQIQGFSYISIEKIQIKNQYSIDQSFIQIVSDSLAIVSQNEKIKIKDFYCIGNIILKKNLGFMISQLAIYSEQYQKIELDNIHFSENSFNQFYDDPAQTTSSLLFINSQQSSVFIENLISQKNALTNSTNSFIYLNVIQIQIINLFVSNHNQIIQSYWNQYFNIDFNQNFDQEIINQIINKVFTIQNKGGALSIITEQISIKNCYFKEILAHSSFILDIITLGQGIVQIQNCSIKQSQNIYSQVGEVDGAISIYSKNSLFYLNFQDITLRNIHNRLSSSILSIIPSTKQNVLKFKNILIENCFSLMNQFMKIQFQLLSIQSNIVDIQNISIIQNENYLVEYFKKIGLITIYEIQKITKDNAFINLQGCNLSIQNLTFQGILLYPILIIMDSQSIYLVNFMIYEIKSFYPLNILYIGQISSINYQVFIQNIEIINLQLFDYCKSQTVIIEQSKLQVDDLKCNINFTIITQNQNSPLKLSWILDQIVLLSNKKGSIIYFSSMQSQNKIKLFQILIFNNDCQNCWNGIIFFDLIQYSSIYISEFQCIKNIIKNNGCIVAKSLNQQESKLCIINSIFNMNNGTIGTAINAENVIVQIKNSKILNNIATQQGGALYLSINNNQFLISQTIIYNNKALTAGAIYFEGNNNINEYNFHNSWMKLNTAQLQPDNIQEMPTQLVLSINDVKMKTIQKKINNFYRNSLILKPYKIIQQGKQYFSKELLIPSNQEIINYKIYNQKELKFQKYIEEFSISYQNSLQEYLSNFSNSSCDVIIQTLSNNILDIIDSKKVGSVQYNFETKNFDLGKLSLTIDPYKNDNYIQQIQIICHLNQVDSLLYDIEIKGFMCQLGEFYVLQGCQICQPNQGYYSVTYNTTKCSIFDQNKFKSITSNQIQLKIGYWRPNYQSDYIESCFKLQENCEGGWFVSNDLCKIGHIGGLCEECDIYNIRGQGNYYKNQLNSICQDCRNSKDNVLPFIFTSIWVIISTILTLRSIDKSNKLFSSLKIRQRFAKIIFKLNQDHESILLKLFLNYVWIFSVIFTFNINFQFSFSFINQTSNTSYFMANNLDCFLSENQNIYLIYNRIITTILLMIVQLLLIYLGFQMYCIIKKQKFNSSMISTTFLYLYVSNYASLIKQFFSLLATRIISNIEYVQGDVSLYYYSTNHQKWIIGFVSPGLGLVGCLIPFSLFFLLYLKREHLDQIKFRRHICYLFNEYNNENYFWEWIKLWKKTVIIIIMTYFETNIFLKASLLGLCLFLYQLYAVKQKPYIIKNLNQLDVSTGQICSVAIFLASINYVSEQQENLYSSMFIQLLLVLLCLKLSFPFFIDLLRVYYKKYKISMLNNLYQVLKFIKQNSCLTLYVNKLIIKMKQREFKLKTNIIKLRYHLLQISKFQLEQQKYQFYQTQDLQ